MRFTSKYLAEKYMAEPEPLMEICKSWGLTKTNFVVQVDSWFGNFQEPDYDLAFKILKEIDFYSKQRIKDVLKSYRQKIERIVSPKKWQAQDIVLIVPDGYGDSAHRHAYDLSKIWKINRNQIYSISQLNAQAVSDKSILIAFNDTYGTGNQFVTDMASNGSLREIAKQKWLFIVGLTVSDIALNYFQYELPDAYIIRTAAPKTVYEVFNYKEMRRIEELGADVYPPHPLGYGGAGLLVAYEFQCPNNSIPLIWANSITANNEFENYSFPWSPLCEYFPKCKSGKSALTRSSELDIHSGNNITTKGRFCRRTNLEFTDADLELINQTLDKWACSTKTHNEIIRHKLTAWFNNFRSEDKELALKIFSNITYLSLARTREVIKNLRDEVLAMISRMNQTKSDIVLVVTGDDIERNYHYVYDFMRKWGLQLAQVSTLKHICRHPYEVVGKHLVFSIIHGYTRTRRLSPTFGRG